MIDADIKLSFGKFYEEFLKDEGVAPSISDVEEEFMVSSTEARWILDSYNYTKGKKND